MLTCVIPVPGRMNPTAKLGDGKRQEVRDEQFLNVNCPSCVEGTANPGEANTATPNRRGEELKLNGKG